MLNKVVTFRMSNEEYETFLNFFINNNLNDKFNQYRTISEYIRYILLNYILLKSNKNRINYFNTNIF